MNIKSRIWIESDKRIFLGVGRIRLLEQIQQDGSINKACKSLNMSYKKAWKLVDEMNAVSKTPVVEKASGGSGGAIYLDAIVSFNCLVYSVTLNSFFIRFCRSWRC